MRKYKTEEIVEKIMAFVEMHGRIPKRLEYTSENNLPCYRVVTKRFGSMENMYKETKLDDEIYKEMGIERKKEDMIKRLKNFVKKNGRKPMFKEFIKANNLPTQTTITIYFGGMPNFYRESGLFYVPMRKHEITREEISRQILEFYDRTGRAPKQDDFANYNFLPSMRIIRTHYTGVVEAKEVAGLGRRGIGAEEEEIS